MAMLPPGPPSMALQLSCPAAEEHLEAAAGLGEADGFRWPQEHHQQ